MFLSERLKTTVLIALLFSFSILNYNCKVNSTITEPTVVTTGGGTGTNQSSIITGQVINSLTGIPIDSAIVQIFNSSLSLSTYTNTLGKFTDSVQISSNTNFTIYVSKSGYQQDTIAVTINAGTNYSAGVVNLIPTSSSGQVPSGNPVSIFLFSQSTQSIGVVGSGSPETATLTFEAVDSSGTPIDLNHSESVSFSFGAQPGGGEILSPSSVQTNDIGQASVNITSGTKAGVVQILAKLTVGAQTIFSMPVSIAIFGGFPDANHFSIAPSVFNFPGYNIFGLTDAINVYVGDKYGNPVRPKTVVYFTTSGGIIGGSASTDQTGTGTVNLLSAAPVPNDPTLGPGFARIVASTADENKNTITAPTVVLFSGTPQLTVNPTTFNIPNGGKQAFNVTLSDQNGNPLAGGTSLTIAVTGQNVGVQGETSVTLPDTQSKTWTHFTFQAYDTSDTTNVLVPVSITISSNGPNGNIETTIYGTSN